MRQAPTLAQGVSSESRIEAWAPHAGEVVNGRYRVLRVIGQGGMGAVVAAEHVTLGEPVAIKFLHPKLARDAASVERFVREAKATTRIKSEHVVRILDVGQSETGIPYIVMELLEGADLGHVLAAGPLSIPNAVDFVLQASEALAEAHAAGIVHRDLKPSNLWLAQRSDGTPLVKVLDFGISKLASHAPGDPKLTETQSVFGSPTYMSPEQIRSAKKVDHRTDIWALGIVLHELLTGKLPFDAETVSGVLACIAADPPTPLRHLRPDAPPPLEAAILSCLEKDLSRRCPSLADLALRLAPFASPIGQLSANRISRIGVAHTSLIPPATSSISGGFSTVGGITERSFSTAASFPQPHRSPLFGVAIGVGAALVVVAVAFGVMVKVSAGKSAAPPPSTPLTVPDPKAPRVTPQVPLVPVAPSSTSPQSIPVAPASAPHGKKSPPGVVASSAPPPTAPAPTVPAPPPAVPVKPVSDTRE